MNESNAVAPQRSSVFDHPIGFWFFFWGEFAERCCFYGMRAILLLYMIQILKFEDGTANRISSYFMAACYLLPLVGGYVADNFLGKYRTIVYFAIPYICGQVLLGIASLHNETCLYLSLGLLAMGSGVIKPNISTLMGLTYDQRRPGRTKLRSDAFAIFYGSINIGAALSSFCVPVDSQLLRRRQPCLRDGLPISGSADGPGVYRVCCGKTVLRHRNNPACPPDAGAAPRTNGRFAAALRSVLRRDDLLEHFRPIGLHLDRVRPGSPPLVSQLVLYGFPLSPDQLQALNPILIIVMLPPITMLWHLLARFGWELRPTDKMLIGFVLTTLTMGITAWAAFRGADAVTAGASAALAGAEKTVAVAAALTDNESADKAAQELMIAAAAVHKAKNLSAKSQEFMDAKAAMEAASNAAKKAGPEAVSVAAAGRAAVSAIRAAELASGIVGKTDVVENGKVASQSIKDAIKTVRTSVRAAKDAAEATNEAMKLVTSAGRERAAASDDSAATKTKKVDLTVCSVAANRAAAAASAAARSVDATEAGNTRAGEVNAAVACVDSADAAVAAVKAAANIKHAAFPDVVAATEEATAAARISLLWQVIPYILMTMAEICISVVGLELAFAAAPAAMKSFVTACWLLTVFFGDLLNAQITPLYNETFFGISLTPDWYFLLFALLMVPVTIAFALVAKRFNRPTTTLS